MTRNKVVIMVIAAVFLFVLAVTFLQVRAAFQRQLAPALVIQVQASATMPAQASPTLPLAAARASPAPLLVPPTSTPQPKTCGQSGVMTLLVVANNTYYGADSGADFIRFARVDFDNQAVGLAAVPDDIWVETPHLSSLNLDHSRLGLVYLSVQQATTGTTAQIATAATNAVAQALYDNYGVSADHYITFDARYFVDAVDQLGGLDLNVTGYITDGTHTFQPGPQHMNGDQAFQYSRILPGKIELIGTWNRMDRQNQVLKALVATLLQPANMVKIPGLIQQFRQDLTTDLTPEQITDLACLAGKVPQDQISTVEVEAPMIIGAGPNDSMIANTDLVKQFLQQQLAR